ncbi:MAG: AsnC family transcriptional regulator [Methanoregula sp.]
MSGAFQPDPADLAILECLQDDLPLVPRPWEAIAARLGIPEPDLLGRLKKLSEAGIIRGISPVLESRHLGLNAATLVALRVPKERIEKVAALVSSYREVSHNFRREHDYSLWFTIAAKDEAGVHAVLDEILSRSGIPASDMLDLPTIRRIKIDVRFSFLSAQSGEGPHGSD